jgi:aspartyl/asparaginyl-tRNA synthetase
VMLRNPVEMLPSLHSQFVYVGLEPVEDFEAALALDAERERSGTPVGFPPSSYRSAIRYSEQLRRYIDVFGRDRVHVIRYEDFRADTRATYRHACEFLGVDPGFEPEIEVINPNKQVRSRLLRRVVRRPPESLRPILHRVTTEAMRRRVGNEMNRLNTKFTRRAPTPDAVSLGIRPDVERQVHELDELLDLDVSSWLD